MAVHRASAQVDERELRHTREREILAEAARTILSHRTLGPLTDAMCRLVTTLVAANSACVITWNGNRYLRAGSHGPEVDQLLAISGFDVRQQYVEASGRTADDERRVQRLEDGPGFVVIPLARTAGNEEATLIDAFLLVGGYGSAHFERTELRVLQEFGALLAVALRNIELYDAMVRANRALKESSEFKSDLLAMLAHDFKGPLTVIGGYCELLLGSAREHREEIEMIHSQTQRLVRLSDDALVLAQTQAEGFSLARMVVDFGTFVVECIEATTPNEPRIVLDVPPATALVELDPQRFRHVVDNLVWNALKYSKDEINVSVRVEGGSAIMDVSDRGIGVPADELSTLFTRFGRASNARRKGIAGSGIGLYVARKIVTVHRGTLTARSIEDEGSTFTVTLPLHTSDEGEAVPPSRGAQVHMENR